MTTTKLYSIDLPEPYTVQTTTIVVPDGTVSFAERRVGSGPRPSTSPGRLTVTDDSGNEASVMLDVGACGRLIGAIRASHAEALR